MALAVAAKRSKVISNDQADIHKVSAEEIVKWQAFLRVELRKIFTAFYILNFAVFTLVASIWAAEAFLLKPSSEKVITEKVILALIAASAAQLGLMAVSAGKLMVANVSGAFPSQRAERSAN